VKTDGAVLRKMRHADEETRVGTRTGSAKLGSRKTITAGAL
jgi:hypothetical protein